MKWPLWGILWIVACGSNLEVLEQDIESFAQRVNELDRRIRIYSQYARVIDQLISFVDTFPPDSTQAPLQAITIMNLQNALEEIIRGCPYGDRLNHELSEQLSALEKQYGRGLLLYFLQERKDRIDFGLGVFILQRARVYEHMRDSMSQRSKQIIDNALDLSLTDRTGYPSA
jgi:hypothetical protein